jgi:hypothetical protein
MASMTVPHVLSQLGPVWARTDRSSSSPVSMFLLRARHQPVGVENQAASCRKGDLGGLERNAPQPEWQIRRHVDELDRAVGQDECGRWVPGSGQGAPAVGRIVDGVQQGRAGDGLLLAT